MWLWVEFYGPEEIAGDENSRRKMLRVQGNNISSALRNNPTKYVIQEVTQLLNYFDSTEKFERITVAWLYACIFYSIKLCENVQGNNIWSALRKSCKIGYSEGHSARKLFARKVLECKSGLITCEI